MNAYETGVASSHRNTPDLHQVGATREANQEQVFQRILVEQWLARADMLHVEAPPAREVVA